jgi:hypothetical protein
MDESGFFAHLSMAEGSEEDGADAEGGDDDRRKVRVVVHKLRGARLRVSQGCLFARRQAALCSSRCSRPQRNLAKPGRAHTDCCVTRWLC